MLIDEYRATIYIANVLYLLRSWFFCSDKLNAEICQFCYNLELSDKVRHISPCWLRITNLFIKLNGLTRVHSYSDNSTVSTAVKLLEMSVRYKQHSARESWRFCQWCGLPALPLGFSQRKFPRSHPERCPSLAVPNLSWRRGLTTLEGTGVSPLKAQWLSEY